MKLKKAMMSLVAATAAGLCISAYADNPEKGQSGTLKLTDPVTTASAVVSDDTLTTTGGTWVNVPTAENGYMVIDCDAATSNEFTATSTTTGAVVQCDFDLQVAPVPLSLRPASAVGAQTAFCVCTNTTDGGAMFFCAWVNSAWVVLDGFTVPAVDTEYMLRVTFDYKNGKYVKFSVKTSGDYVDLYDATPTNWFATGSAATGVSQYCFVGTGNVKSFALAQSDVEAEDAPVTPPGGGDPVTIEIPEEALAAVSGATTGAKVEELLKDGSNNQPQLNNYILFGLDNTGAIKAEAKPVSKISTVLDGGNIPLSFDNLNVQNVPGTTVKYTLKGRKTYNGEWETLVNEGAASAMKITPENITAGYKFFKVSVDVSYTGK